MCVPLQVVGVRVMFGVKIFLCFWEGGGEGTFATINRKNIFLGRAQIFPRQGTNFLSNEGNFPLVGMFAECCEISQF